MILLEFDRYDCSCLARRSTGNHRNTRELWRITISESVFCRQSWLSQLHQLSWLCDERARLWCRSCYTPSPPPGSPTVTLIHCVTLCNPQLWHSLRPDYVTSQSMDVPPMWRFWLTRCITFSSRKVKIREQAKGFFIFPEVDLVLSGVISDQSIDVTSN